MDSKKKKLLEESYERILNVGLCMRPYEDLSDIIDPDIMLFGTTKDEEIHSFSEADKLFMSQYEAMHGMESVVERKRISTQISGEENVAIIMEEITMKLTSADTVNQFIVRGSAVMVYIDGIWKLTHWHASRPVNTDYGDHWHMEEWKQEKQKLQQLVDQQTVALKQNYRELQIEAALEKIRSSSLAMHKTDDLSAVVRVLFEQMKALSVDMGFASVSIFIFENGSRNIQQWQPTADGVSSIRVPYFDHPISADLFDAKDNGADYFEKVYTLEEKNTWLEHGFELTDYKDLPEEFKASLLQAPGYAMAITLAKNSGICIPSFVGVLPSPEDVEIMKRVGKVFEQAYIRFLDLLKAEAQTREAQIEAATERVRAEAMAMHSTEDFGKVARQLLHQMQNLSVEGFTGASIYLIGEDDFVSCYDFSSFGNMADAQSQFLRYDANKFPILGGYALNQWKKGEQYFELDFDFDMLQAGTKELAEINIDVADSLKEALAGGHLTHQWDACGRLFNGFIAFDMVNPPNEDVRNITIKMAHTFEQAYIRFLDLQKAEAQAREAQIEAALERVRAQTMAMQNSEDVGKCVVKMFAELTALGVDEGTRFGIGILNHDNENNQVWTARKDGEEVKMHIGHLDMSWHPLLQNAREAWKAQVPIHKYVLEGEELLNYYRMLNNAPDYEIHIPIEKLPNKEIQHCFIFEQGFFYAFSPHAFKPDLIQITKRFSSLFEQTYRRYLDLVRAEAQAKETKIEAALEKIRSRTMGMQSSDELPEVANLLFTEVRALGIRAWSCGYNILAEDHKTATCCMSSEGTMQTPFQLRLWGEASFEEMGDFIHSDKTMLVQELGGKALEAHYVHMKSFPDLKPTFDEIDRLGLSLPTYQINHLCKFTQGFILFITYEKVSDAHDIFRRFTHVFDQTYTRFLDLKRAEAQAREAQIEASLERVRGKALAMHNSQDIADTIGVFYRELKSFSLTPRRCGVGLLNKVFKEGEIFTWNTTEQGESLELVGKLSMEGHPVLENVYENWVSQTDYYPVLRGNEIREYYKVLRPMMAFPDYAHDDVQYGYFFFFNEGGVYAWTEKEMNEDEIQIYRRFTSVLSLTYSRYKDLKEAEARAAEAVKQAALDRVRAEISSMRTADDLQRITPLMWHELTTLGVPFFRCGVFIIKEHEQLVHAYLSTPDGQSLAVLHLPFEGTGTTYNTVDHWRHQRVYTEHWDKEQFKTWTHSMVEQGQIAAEQEYQAGQAPPESLCLQFIPFTQGMLYIGSADPLNEGQIELAHALASAFAVAYARYEDFIKLESAKKQIEIALIDLQQTQAQLVQSEKMASLGELTAGIAHEIQNPLNFVNNFSEVNLELISELVDEVDKGNTEEVKQIAADIKENSDRIQHHGKRADAIVKGMLQHSQKSTGHKEATDINALCDEYLRLAYHGLRAKDNTFNVTLHTDLDPMVGRISLIPQDMGRVLLNLINNAFYAVAEKSRTAGAGYEPTVGITTKREATSIRVSITDNGNGIPKQVIDKIFQPFFTTKPTGEGTGLGLSLSYDMVTKGHGGELKVKTIEGEGTEFIILLPRNS